VALVMGFEGRAVPRLPPRRGSVAVLDSGNRRGPSLQCQQGVASRRVRRDDSPVSSMPGAVADSSHPNLTKLAGGNRAGIGRY
jgi:hypothetical protein